MFNLMDIEWLRVKTIKNKSKKISLLEFIKKPELYLNLDFPFPGHNLAVLRFLISLLYIHNQPVDEKEWIKFYQESNPFESIEDFDKRFRPYLNLLDKDKPFMQSTKFEQKNKPEILNKIFIEAPANTGSTFFYHRGNDFVIDINDIPSYLLASQLYVPLQAGVGYYKGINQIPIYIYLKGINLKETIVLNTLHKEFVENENNKIFSEGLMKKNFSIDDLLSFDDGKHNARDISIIAGLNWRSRKIKINYVESEESKISITGEKTNQYVDSIYYKSGAGCNDYWQDSMVVREMSKDSYRNTKAEKYKPAWKGYTSLLFNKEGDKTHTQKALVLQQYDELSGNLSELDLSIPVELFGFIFKSGGKAFYSLLKDTLIYSHKLIEEPLLYQFVDNIINHTNESIKILKNALRNIAPKHSSKSKNIFTEEDEIQFWKSLEIPFKNIFNDLINSDSNNYNVNELEYKWLEDLTKSIRTKFDQMTSVLNLSAVHIESIIKGKKQLNIAIKKYFDKTFSTKEN